MQPLLNCRELDDLHSGAIKKGALPDSRPEGTASPQDGDLVSVYSHHHARLPCRCTYSALFDQTYSYLVQVYFHLTVRREDDRVVETTRLIEDGVEGTGVPKAFVLGKGLRAPRGWELALSGLHNLIGKNTVHNTVQCKCCPMRMQPLA